MSIKNNICAVSSIAIVASLGLYTSAFADTSATVSVSESVPQAQLMMRGQEDGRQGKRVGQIPGQAMLRPAVFGKVTSINGTTVNITGRQVGPVATGTKPVEINFTVDASVAMVRKANATTTVSGIAVGDNIMVQGTVTGTNVKATLIFESFTGGRMMKPDKGDKRKKNSFATSTLPFKGTGQPVIVGTISATSGTSLTVTNPSGITYSIDVSAAKFIKGTTTAALSDFAKGDKVVIQGTVNGTLIVASTVIEPLAPQMMGTREGDNPQTRGFLGGIGQSFKRLFKF